MVLNVALRYPHTEHEIGVDSFFIHTLATNIANDHFAEWLINPLSVFGWFPLSYPSAGPFLLSGFSDAGGISIEGSILVLSLAFGALGVLTSFAMAREFKADNLFCLVLAFSYSFAPRFLAFTLWSASMRGLFMVLLPVFIWGILRAYREPKIKNLVLLLGLFLLLAVVHRLAALLAVVLVASIAAVLMLLVVRIIRMSFPQVFLSTPYRRVSPFIALFSFVTLMISLLFGTGLLQSYSSGELAEGSSFEIQLLNLGVSLARSVGLSLLFAVPGILFLVRTRNQTLREPFLLLAFLGLTPTLFLREYTGFYILPFIAILASLAVLTITKVRGTRTRRVLLATSLGAIFVFSAAILDYEISRTSVLTETTYTTSIYMHPGTMPCRIVANDGLLAIRVAAISGCSVIPVGGAGTTFQSPELLAYRFFSPEEIANNLVRIPLTDLTLESDSPWIVPFIQSENDWVTIMQSPYNASNPALNRYDPSYFLENKHFSGAFFAYGNRYPSILATTAYDGAYKTYDSETESLWYVASNRG